MGHRTRIAAFAAALVTLSAVAQGEPLEQGSFRLVWSAPAGCPTDREALARVEALLGERVSALRIEPLAARAHVTALEPGRYELTLETFQGAQRFTRSMQAGSCAELTDAGALVLALAIDPSLVERNAARQAVPATAGAPSAASTSTESAPKAASAAAAAAAPAAATPPTPSTQPSNAAPSAEPDEPSASTRGQRDDARWALGAALAVDFGTIADVAVGPELGVAFERPGFEVALDATWLPPRRSFAQPGKGGDISLAAAALRFCYRALERPIGALGCGLFELGALDGEGVGTTSHVHRTAVWAAPGVRLLGRARLSSDFILTLGAAALVPIQPVDFTLENVGVVHQVPSVVGRLTLGLGGYFD